MFVINPAYQKTSPIYRKLSPHKSSDPDEKTEAHRALALQRLFSELGTEKADMVATNPFFSSSIEFRNEVSLFIIWAHSLILTFSYNTNQVNMLVINKHFGQAKPDYKALTNRRGKWTVEVTEEG